jgi:hypothetical protein
LSGLPFGNQAIRKLSVSDPSGQIPTSGVTWCADSRV